MTDPQRARVRIDTSLALLASSLLLGSGVTVAQAAEPPSDRRMSVIEEITVTARRVEESLQETPISVAVFSRRDLEGIGASEAGDIAHYTPNLSIRKQSGSQDDFAVGIRGVANGEPALTIDPTVGIYMDGVYLARSTGVAFDIVDLERIEILRGPQGALFGRNAIGGAINIVTERPREELAYRQQVTAGNRSHQRHHLTLDTGRHGGFAAKLSGLYTERAGEVRSQYNGHRQGSSETEAVRLALNWSKESFVADYSFDYYRRESNATINQLSFVRDTVANPASPFFGGPYFQQAAATASASRVSTLAVKGTGDDDNRSRIDAHALTLSWEINPDFTIKSITSYREWDKNQFVPMDYASFPADGMTLIDAATFMPIASGTLVPIFDTRRDSDQRQKTQELQFIGSALDERLHYTAGLYYFEETGSEENPQRLVIPTCLALGEPGCAALGTSLFLSLPDFAYSIDNRSWAVYGEISYDFTERLEVIFGYRYTEDRKKAELTNSLDNVLQTVAGSKSWSNFNPGITASYIWSDTVTTYAKLTTGFRSGGFNARATRVEDFLTPFDEEEISAAEIGLKSDLLDNTLRLNAAFFHMRYSDQQIAQFSAGSGGGASTISNAGKSTTTGIELELTWLPVRGLMLAANYGFIEQDFKRFDAGVVDPVSGFPLGINADIADSASTIRYSPKHSAALIAEYEFAPTNLGQLSLRIDSTYSGAITFHPQYDLYDRSGSHTLVNARVTLADISAGRSGRLRGSLWGRNLGNEKYRDFGIDFGSLGYAINSYGQLRSYGIDIVYEFNR